MDRRTSFQQVADMNVAFGNPKGEYTSFDMDRIRAQVANILDEYNEFLAAADANNAVGMRDALCDIQVFALGAQHLMGVDGDADMKAVVDGVMTRFIKDTEDLNATIALHAAKGVTKVYFEGEFPRMVMKSAEDQPDAPKGKFLKSASYRDTVFPAVLAVPAQDGPRIRKYFNSNGKVWHEDTEDMLTVVGTPGDYIAYDMGDHYIRSALWNDVLNAWVSCPAEVI